MLVNRIDNLNVGGRVWCVTVPDSGMNGTQSEQISQLKGRLPQQPKNFDAQSQTTIISGIGQRFLSTGQALGLNIRKTSEAFGSEGLEKIDVKSIIQQLNQLSEGSIILADVSVLRALGVDDVQACALYLIKGYEILESKTLETAD